MKKEDKKGTNKKKIKWLIVGYSLLFISVLTFCLLNYEEFAFCFAEILYLALFFILTLPFIIGIEVTNKKVIYPLYYVAILLLTWGANTLTYFTYSSLTLFLFAVSLTPIIYERLSNEKSKKLLRMVIPIFLLIISLFFMYGEIFGYTYYHHSMSNKILQVSLALKK